MTYGSDEIRNALDLLDRHSKSAEGLIGLEQHFWDKAPKVETLIKEHEALFDAKRRKHTVARRGKVMEEIAAYIFGGLRAVKEIRTVQTAGGQIDLIVEGDPLHPAWPNIMKAIGLDPDRKTIVVEAKSISKKADVGVTLKLQGLLMTHFQNTAALGVIFSQKGMSGDDRACLQHGRLYQVIGRAKGQSPVVAIGPRDFRADLNLISLLREKIREIDETHSRSSDDESEPPSAVERHHLADAIEWHHGIRDR